MSYSGDAAEQVVRLSLETGEVAVKLTGEGAKQLAILLYAILREQKKTKGKTRLTSAISTIARLKRSKIRLILLASSARTIMSVMPSVASRSFRTQ